MKKDGFTLVELIIVIAIMVLLVMVAIGGIDPIGIFNRARDAQRKKDLNRIKISFEDYFNDKGCYPNSEMVNKLTLDSNCGTSIFRPWLSTWPCDPNGTHYQILVGYDVNCPKWYKILATLENKTDKDISETWISENLLVGTTGVNYGVSSGNITVETITGSEDPYCLNIGSCYYIPEPNMCNKKVNGCLGSNCFLGECSVRCRVDCCGAGCN